MAHITLFAVQLGYPALDGFKSISHFLAGLERVPGPFYNTANNNNNNKKRLRPTATRNLLARKSRLSESPLVPNSTVRNVAITTHMTRTGVKHVRNAAKKAMSHPNVAVEELLPEKTKANILIKVRVTPITVTKLTTRYSLNLTKSPLLTQNQ